MPPKCKCGSCCLQVSTLRWTYREELAQTMGSHWKYCPLCGSPLPDYAASLQNAAKGVGQMAEAFQSMMLKLAPYLQKVYEAAKAQGLLDDKEDEDDAD